MNSFICTYYVPKNLPETQSQCPVIAHTLYGGLVQRSVGAHRFRCVLENT